MYVAGETLAEKGHGIQRRVSFGFLSSSSPFANAMKPVVIIKPASADGSPHLVAKSDEARSGGDVDITRQAVGDSVSKGGSTDELHPHNAPAASGTSTPTESLGAITARCLQVQNDQPHLPPTGSIQKSLVAKQLDDPPGA